MACTACTARASDFSDCAAVSAACCALTVAALVADVAGENAELPGPTNGFAWAPPLSSSAKRLLPASNPPRDNPFVALATGGFDRLGDTCSRCVT